MNITDILIVIFLANLPVQCTEWLSGWIDAYTSMFRCKFSDAVNKLQVIETKSQFGNNEIFQVLIGQCLHYNGEHERALQYLSRAYAQNPYMIDGLMTLAALYAIQNKVNDLERLTVPSMSVTEYLSEHWFVWAQLFYVQKKYEKASYFAHKSCFLNVRNIEASLLKGR